MSGRCRVFVPQAFDLFGPISHFLDVIEHQHAGARQAGQRTRDRPLGTESSTPLQAGPVGADAVLRHARPHRAG